VEKRKKVAFNIKNKFRVPKHDCLMLMLRVVWAVGVVLISTTTKGEAIHVLEFWLKTSKNTVTM